MVTGATPGWEVLILLSWRPDYVAFQLTCGLCYSKTCLDSPKQIMLQGQSTKKSKKKVCRLVWSVLKKIWFLKLHALVYLVSLSAQVFILQSRSECFCFLLRDWLCSGGGGHACACTRVGSSGTVCTLCIKKQAFCCMGMWRITEYLFFLMALFTFIFFGFLFFPFILFSSLLDPNEIGLKQKETVLCAFVLL